MEEIAYLLISTVAVLATFYAVHRLLAPRSRGGEGGRAPYACGEDLPPERVPFTVVFYKYVCLFTVTDVVAMLLAFAFSAALPLRNATLQYAVLTYCLTLVIVLLSTVGWDAK
ncbi:MAG: NADH-quinone oxidoreductase subunit A [Thermofilum sp.]